jgi:hypothetical protein
MVVARGVTLSALAALAVLTACSGDEAADAGSPASAPSPAPARATTIPLGPAPEAVGQLCGITALKVQGTVCPTKFPLKRGSQAADGQELRRDGYGGYLLEWHVTKFRGDDAGHVVVASQPREFDLSGGAAVKTDGPMALPGRKKLLRRTKVGTGAALVLQSPPYPRGGINGGHVSVLWNSDGRGHLVSLHFQGYALRDRIAAAVGMARSSTLVPPGGNCDPGSDCG